MTALVRMAIPKLAMSPMSQNYMLAATKVHYKPFWLGSILGILPETVLIGYVTTQIKNVESAFDDDDEDKNNTV